MNHHVILLIEVGQNLLNKCIYLYLRWDRKTSVLSIQLLSPELIIVYIWLVMDVTCHCVGRINLHVCVLDCAHALQHGSQRLWCIKAVTLVFLCGDCTMNILCVHKMSAWNVILIITCIFVCFESQVLFHTWLIWMRGHHTFRRYLFVHMGVF